MGNTVAIAQSSPEFREGLEACWISEDTVVPHKEGYQSGRHAAVILNLAYAAGLDMKPDTGDENPDTLKKVLRTRSDFALQTAILLTEMGKPKLAGCLLAKLSPLQNQAWSSVHSGLTDYLESKLKDHFFSVPER